MEWSTLLTPLIVALVPLLTMLGKRYLPARYKVMVLGLAVSLGPVLDYLSTWLSQQPASPGRGVLLGMAGVALREVIDQVRKGPSPTAPTSIVPRSIEAPALLLATALALAGCAFLPDMYIDCQVKGAISGTGGLQMSAGMGPGMAGGGGLNNGTLMADCGSGFKYHRSSTPPAALVAPQPEPEKAK